MLLACSGATNGDAAGAHLRSLIAGGLDWDKVIDQAVAHGVMPLLYWKLEALCPEAVPEAALERLRCAFHANTGKNLALARKLLDLLAVLASKNIAAIPFKGPVLAVSAHGGLGFRQAGDLDILVEPRDVARAEAQLAARGYHAAPPWYLETWGDRAAPIRRLLEYNRELLPEQGDDIVELHWAFAEPFHGFQPDQSRLRERLRSCDLVGKPVPILGPEDTLLILCVHGARHRWERLCWIGDLAALIRVHPELRWDELFDEARRQMSLRMLVLGLHLARDLLACELPASVAQIVDADRTASALAREVGVRLFAADVPARGLTARPFNKNGDTLDSARFQLRVRDRGDDRSRYLSYLFQITLTPTARDRAAVHGRPGFLAWLVPPLRLGAGWGGKALRGLLPGNSRAEANLSPVGSPEAAPGD